MQYWRFRMKVYESLYTEDLGNEFKWNVIQKGFGWVRIVIFYWGCK